MDFSMLTNAEKGLQGIRFYKGREGSEGSDVRDEKCKEMLNRVENAAQGTGGGSSTSKYFKRAQGTGQRKVFHAALQSKQKQGRASQNDCQAQINTGKQGGAGFSTLIYVEQGSEGSRTRMKGFSTSKYVKPGLWSVTKHGGRVAARQSTSNQGFVNVRVHMLGFTC